MPPKPQLPLPSEGESKIDLFRRRGIRKVLHDNEWWFAVKDVLEVLTDTKDGTRYASDLRKKDPGLGERYSEITRTLDFASGSGKQKTNFVNVEGIFRLMQSVPTQKAEPFKKWLARVGFERLQEIQNPELAIKRAITIYRSKGYDDAWIDARIRNKASRELLTAEWSKRGASNYIGLLTDAISVETFGIGVAQHKRLKGLKGQGLRDNMTPIELTLTTLGEQVTTEIIKTTNPTSLDQHKNAAMRGGKIAGSTRRQIESETGKSVVSSANYLTERQRLENTKESSPEINDIMKRLLKVTPKISDSKSQAIDAIIQIPNRTSQQQLIKLSTLLKNSLGNKKVGLLLPSGKLVILEYKVNYNESLATEVDKILKEK